MESLYFSTCKYCLDIFDINYDILTHDNIIVDIESKSGLMHSFIIRWMHKNINDLIFYLNTINVKYDLRKEEL